MITCPRCSYENEDSAMNCASCGINLQWALENLQEAGLHEPESLGGPPPKAQAGSRVARGFLVIVLLAAIPASGFLALRSFLEWSMTPSYNRSGGDLAVAGFWAVVAVGCIPAAIAVALPRRARARFLRGLRILALVALTGGLLFGLMRLTLVILPEHTGRSLIIQYTLGERDFRGANLEQADLSGAKLYDADLSGANLSGADLREADLSGASLLQTILRGADLSEATVTDEQLDKAWHLEGTILPDGSVHE
jgi:hypothetical protein